MSSSLLERARGFHEDLEIYEREIIEQLEKKPRTQKERVVQQHRVNNLLEGATERCTGLHSMYEDKDGAVTEEVGSMRGQRVMDNFYSRLKETWTYHTVHPDLPVTHGPNVEAEMEPKVQFSGEEMYGKYFDLHDMYVRWVNLPQCKDKRLDYVQFLEALGKFEDIPEQEKLRGKGYPQFLQDLRDYLASFLVRTQPLVNLDEVLGDTDRVFEELWEMGKVPGWSKDGTGGRGGVGGEGGGEELQPLDLSRFYDAEELQALGMNRLKEALEALGVKCGGTLKERANRLFSLKGVAPGDIDPKLKAKGKRGKGSAGGGAGKGGANGTVENGGGGGGGVGGNAKVGSREERRKALGALECKVKALLDVQTDMAEVTKRQVEKKQTRTVEERDQEIQEEEQGALPEFDEEEEEESDDEGPIYNPLNLPLGWDGKPIPYWLYKLHGLGVEYRCEICGDFSYKGRRNFDRHFQEWRHAHGMRCLGIPNTKHFHDIILIQDARDLFEKIKGQLEVEQWNAEDNEEYEDNEGNVLNRRTFEDLARQGLM